MPVPFEARHGIGSGILGASGAAWSAAIPLNVKMGSEIKAQRREDAARARYDGAMTTLMISAVILTIGSGIVLLMPSIFERYPHFGGMLYLAAVLCFLFFGYCLSLLIQVSLKDPVEVRLDASGLYDRSWSDKPIPWADIIEGHERFVAGRPILCLLLPAAEEAGEVQVDMRGLDHSHAELMAAFAAWRAAYPPNLPNAAS